MCTSRDKHTQIPESIESRRRTDAGVTPREGRKVLWFGTWVVLLLFVAVVYVGFLGLGGLLCVGLQHVFTVENPPQGTGLIPE